MAARLSACSRILVLLPLSVSLALVRARNKELHKLSGKEEGLSRGQSMSWGEEGMGGGL